MARRCDICGKSAMAGNNVSHSKRRTKRVWRPNIQRATMTLGNVTGQVKVCTRCLRTQKKVVAG